MKKENNNKTAGLSRDTFLSRIWREKQVALNLLEPRPVILFRTKRQATVSYTSQVLNHVGEITS